MIDGAGNGGPLSAPRSIVLDAPLPLTTPSPTSRPATNFRSVASPTTPISPHPAAPAQVLIPPSSPPSSPPLDRQQRTRLQGRRLQRHLGGSQQQRCRLPERSGHHPLLKRLQPFLHQSHRDPLIAETPTLEALTRAPFRRARFTAATSATSGGCAALTPTVPPQHRAPGRTPSPGTDLVRRCDASAQG